ncbi:MAG: nitrate reductase cytochrome c-type subunit [Thermodesulfovibrionales bacterium]
MKSMYSKALIAAAAALTLTLGVHPAFGDKKQSRDKSEQELGIRTAPLYDEEKEKPDHGEYSTTEPGKSKRIERAFENSPPLIPHDLTGMLPIAETNNACLGCHMPEQAKSLGATPLPRSHFTDMDTGKNLGSELDGKRYPCMQCHVPQVKIPEPIKNTFKPDFRNKRSKTSSDLLDSLNEGVKAE